MENNSILIKAAISQLLADAGINRTTIKEMIVNIINEKIDRVIKKEERSMKMAFNNELEDNIKKAVQELVSKEMKKEIGNQLRYMKFNINVEFSRPKMMNGDENK